MDIAIKIECSICHRNDKFSFLKHNDKQSTLWLAGSEQNTQGFSTLELQDTLVLC